MAGNLATRPELPVAPATTLARIYTRELVAYPYVVGQVRHAVEARLRFWGHEALRDSVALCLTEMLANVGKHAGSLDCVLCIEDLGASVRLTVSDTCQLVPVARVPDWTAESGRGVHLIATTADLFGSTVTPTGKNVWAVFRCRAEAVT